MATFISLMRFTEQGIKHVRDTAKRAEGLKARAKQMGAQVKDIYWMLGEHDGLVIFDAPDDATATALALWATSQGNVQTTTSRAFTAEEITGVLQKISG